MATVDFTIKQHDDLPVIAAQLQDADENPVDITGATVRFVMKNKATPTEDPKVDAAASITNAAQGLVMYAWDPTDTDEVGTFIAEWEVTFVSGKIETFPNWKNLIVKVFDDIGGVR